MPFDHFDFVAGIYARVPPFAVSEAFLRLLALPVAGNLLDVGGGTGRVSARMRNFVDLCVVLDTSRGMLRHALDQRLNVVCAPAEALPFSDKLFSRVIMHDAFHHLRDQSASICEFWRVLSPGGRIVIIEPDIDLFSTKLLAVFEKCLMMRSHFLSAERIAALIPFPDARLEITREASTACLVAEKVRSM